MDLIDEESFKPNEKSNAYHIWVMDIDDDQKARKKPKKEVVVQRKVQLDRQSGLPMTDKSQ